MSLSHYNFCIFIVSPDNQYWKDFSQLVPPLQGGKALTQETRALLFQELIHTKLIAFGEPLQCPQCKQSIDLTRNEHRIMTMVHSDHSAIEIIWIAVSLACEKEECGREATSIVAKKWKEYRKIFYAHSQSRMYRSCAHCHRIEKDNDDDDHDDKKEERFMVCGRCKAVHYCSPACQEQGWINGHKRYCFDASLIEKK